MKTVAIITARGSSKRIPHKNIREFCGRPIIEYSIQAALASGAFTEVMVSTEDEQIKTVSEKAGAKVPFLRSQKAADDFATTDEVIYEVLSCYEQQGRHFDRFCCIYPTAVFITPQRLSDAMALLDTAESVMPVVAFSYPPQRSFVIRDGSLVRRFPEFASARSQDLEKFYHDCGQFYACRTDAFLRDKTTDVADLKPLILPETEVQDIDTMQDWQIAEAKYRRLHPEITA